MCVILLDRCWVVHIPFVCIVKFKFLAHYYYYFYYYSLEFFTSALADGFHWRLSDIKSPQVSRTLLSILEVFRNVVIWMVSTQPPTSKSSRSFNNPLVTVPKAPITIGIIVTFMFHSFFNSLARSRYLSLFSDSFSFILWSIIIIIIISPPPTTSFSHQCLLVVFY